MKIPDSSYDYSEHKTCALSERICNIQASKRVSQNTEASSFDIKVLKILKQSPNFHKLGLCHVIKFY